MGSDCGIALGSPAHFTEIFGRARKDRIPISGTLDVTYRCNFRCRHCYVGHLVGQSRSEAVELDTAQVTRLLGEAADAGCLFLLLSGGEPLLRDDFVQVYRSARRLGMIVTVFTNASLVQEEHLEAFREYPPRMVEVSLYGASEATCKRVTGVPGSYRAARKGIERLLDAGVVVGLKTVILRENVHEISAIAGLAEELGLKYRMDPLVTPRLDGDWRPLAQRVEPGLAAEVEFGNEKSASSMVSFMESQLASGPLEPVSSLQMYRCGAGHSSFHLDPTGAMHPCLMSPEIGRDTLAAGFLDAWETIVAATDQATWSETGLCATCSTASLCGYCPGLLLLERASPTEPPEYLCRLAECRHGLVDADVRRAASVSAK